MLRLLAAISALAEKLDPQKACSVGRVRFPESREERALMAAASMRETRVASSRPTERTPIEKLRVNRSDSKRIDSELKAAARELKTKTLNLAYGSRVIN